MAVAHTMQTSFLVGEVSPRYLGNTNTEEYRNALRNLENGYVLSQGGIRKRPGSQLLSYTLENFQLESGDGVVLYDQVQNFVTKYSNDFRLFKYYTSDGNRWVIIAVNDTINNWCVLNLGTGKLYPLVGDPKPTSATNIGVFSYNQWSYFTNGIIMHSPGNRLNFANIDLAEIQIEQTGDVLLVTHADIPPITIRNLKTIHFDLTPANNFNFPCASIWHTAFMPRGTAIVNDSEYRQTIPLLDLNQDNNLGQGGISISSGATSIGGAVTLTSSLSIFTSEWVGTFIRLTDLGPNHSGIFYISTYTSASTVGANFVAGIKPSSIHTYGISANTYWEESAWSNKNGFPRAVAAFGNRVLYAGTRKNPNRIWCSAVADIDQLCEVPFSQDPSFSTYLTDNSRAFYIDLIGASEIQWLSVGKRIFVGAKNKEFVIYSPDAAFGPDSYKVDTATTFGSAYRQPIRSSSEVLFTQRSGQRLRSMVFSFQEDDYRSQDLTRLAEHVARDAFTAVGQLYQNIPVFEDISLATSPEPRIWIIDNNGGLSSCTFDREGGLAAWSRHKLGGSPVSSSYTYPFVSAILQIPSYDETADEIAMVVKRKVAGTEKVFIEKLGPYFDLEEYTHDYFNPLAGYPDYLRTRAIFLDCCQGSVPVTPTNTFTFANMANETLSVVADGQYLGEYTLNGSGVLTLERSYSEVLVGYKYFAKITTVDYEIPGSPASNIGKFKTAYELMLSFNKTHGCQVRKRGQADWQTLQFVRDATPVDGPVELFTGFKEVKIGGVSKELGIEIQDDSPFPFEILGLVFKVVVE